MRPVRSGKWQIMINGESYKWIVAEAAKKALGLSRIEERICIGRSASASLAGREGSQRQFGFIWHYNMPPIIEPVTDEEIEIVVERILSQKLEPHRSFD